MENSFNDENKSVVFLDKNQEVKVVLTTIPHSQVYIKNENGILRISKNVPFKMESKKGSQEAK